MNVFNVLYFPDKEAKKIWGKLCFCVGWCSLILRFFSPSLQFSIKFPLLLFFLPKKSKKCEKLSENFVSFLSSHGLCYVELVKNFRTVPSCSVCRSEIGFHLTLALVEIFPAMHFSSSFSNYISCMSRTKFKVGKNFVTQSNASLRQTNENSKRERGAEKERDG